MNKFILFLLLLIPFAVLADTKTYEDLAGSSQMVADSFGEIWTFFFDDTPSMIDRFMAYVVEFVVYLKLVIWKAMLQSSWQIAKLILEDLAIMSQLLAQTNALSPDVTQALVDMRLFDALNLLLQAAMTRFVMTVL